MTKTELPEDAISLGAAGRLIGFSGATIRRWIKLGQLAGFRVGCHWRVSREDVLALVTRPTPAGSPMVQTKAEKRARDAETDRVLREAGIRK